MEGVMRQIEHQLRQKQQQIKAAEANLTSLRRDELDLIRTLQILSENSGIASSSTEAATKELKLELEKMLQKQIQVLEQNIKNEVKILAEQQYNNIFENQQRIINEQLNTIVDSVQQQTDLLREQAAQDSANVKRILKAVKLVRDTFLGYDGDTIQPEESKVFHM
ncbi:hypothetical protein QN277_009683 [Acacia crassicarpa]|uniref:Uncharacterized protein n=1 Tax=Acacia crassicarpa TaxID=499986 RepID=A0AAE1IPU4_9FABA|nr:hypothetical protein QN277_009683 [Acacia crassicarpa]